jgi:hypothetical protein
MPCACVPVASSALHATPAECAEYGAARGSSDQDASGHFVASANQPAQPRTSLGSSHLTKGKWKKKEEDLLAFTFITNLTCRRRDLCWAARRDTRTPTGAITAVSTTTIFDRLLVHQTAL